MQASSKDLPADDLRRHPTLVDPDTPDLPHIGIGAGVYTVLVSGADTDGRYTLIDMLIPAGSGPPPHRHDFEEMFHLLEGEMEVTVRGETHRLHAGQTINIPANAPHGFRIGADGPARLLCFCLPAGQEEFFALVGERLPTRTTLPEPLTAAVAAERRQRILALAPRFRTELLPQA
jgi:quercetin dioxygenase-like cupin family protein